MSAVRPQALRGKEAGWEIYSRLASCRGRGSQTSGFLFENEQLPSGYIKAVRKKWNFL